MEMKRDKHLGLMIDGETHYKLRYIAQYEGRTGNGQVLYWIRQEIKAFEEAHGEIVYIKQRSEE